MSVILVTVCLLSISFVRNVDSFSMKSLHSKTFSLHNNIDGAIDSVDVVHDSISGAKTLKTGVVLLAQPTEFNHFLTKSAVFVYDFGTGRGSKGVILERATAFSMGETSPNSGPFNPNTLYLGGEDGSDKALMFHKYATESSKYIGAGIYTGGLREAKMLIENNEADPKDFKFIFNSVEWGPDQLENEVKAGRWDVANIPPDLILQQTSSSVSLWSYARNTLRSLGGLTGDDAKMTNDLVEDLGGNIIDDENNENSYPV